MFTKPETQAVCKAVLDLFETAPIPDDVKLEICAEVAGALLVALAGDDNLRLRTRLWIFQKLVLGAIASRDDGDEEAA